MHSIIKINNVKKIILDILYTWVVDNGDFFVSLDSEKVYWYVGNLFEIKFKLSF